MTKPNDPAAVAAERFVNEVDSRAEHHLLLLGRKLMKRLFIWHFNDAHKPLYDELAAAKAEIRRLRKLVDRYGAERVKLCEEGKLDNGPTQEGASDG